MKNLLPLRALVMACSFALLGGVASADYKDAVISLMPDHYWQLDETTEGTAVDSGNAATKIDGTHAGIFGPGFGEVGVDGPTLADFPGFDEDNRAFGAFNSASIGLGPGSALADSTMTVAGWFKIAGSQGGDRLWTNNQGDGNTSFQIFFGGGFGDTAASIGIGLNPAVNGFPAEGLPSGSGVGNFHIPDSTVPTKDNEWHHIVASRNGNNIEDVLVVIDGVHYDVDTWRDSTDTWGTTSTDAQIATRTPGDGGASQHVINGTADEIAVWLGRQLTVAESISLYQAAANPTAGIPGDFDGDGDVDIVDFGTFGNNFGMTGLPLDPPTPGDFEPDGDVDIVDFGTFGANFGTGVPGAAIPEPASAVLALLGLCFAAVRRSS